MERLSFIETTFLNTKKDPWGGMTVFVLINKVVRGVEMNIPVKIDQQHIIHEFVDYLDFNIGGNVLLLFSSFTYENGINTNDFNLQISINFILNTLNR